MALTNYRAYKWLIETLENSKDQRYGMTLDELNQDYKLHRYKIYSSGKSGLLSPDDIEKDYKWYKDPDNKKTDKSYGKDNYISYKTLINWRNAIWKEFGLIIWHPEEKVARDRYILVNPELLDENKSLRETIEHLAADEERGYSNKSPFTISNRGRKPKDSQPLKVLSGMEFVSTDSNDVDYLHPQLGYQYMEEPEMVSIIQFAMTVSEALVINYSKVMTKEERAHWNYTPEELFILEPQQLLNVNGRWYVAGNLYQNSYRKNQRIVIYDVEKIKLYDGEKDIYSPSYQLQEGFDIYNLIPSNWNKHFNTDKVVSLYLRVAGTFLDANPFCDVQEKIEEYKSVLYNLYKVFVKPDENFFVQFMAYGDELRLFHPYDKNEITPLVISEEQYQYLNNLRKRGL